MHPTEKQRNVDNARQSRIDQGLPPSIEDDETLANAGALLAAVVEVEAVELELVEVMDPDGDIAPAGEWVVVHAIDP